MTTNPMIPDLNPDKIARLLSISTQQMDTNTLSALSNARQNALARQAVRSPVLALSTNHGAFHGLVGSFSFQQWIVTALLVILLAIGSGYWHNVQQEEQIADTDLAILTDDVPIDSLVD